MNRTLIAQMLSITALVVSAAGRSHVVAQAAQEQGATPVAAYSYRLAAGDVLDLKFPYHTDFNETVTIRPDGRISLVMIGELRAESRTPVELAAVINERYEKVVRRPEVSVIVREFTPQRAYVGGEVVAPGVVDLRGRITSLQAVLKTGGLKSSARLDGVLLVRYSDDNVAAVRKLNLKRVLEGREEDAVLQPFDVLYVPTSRIGTVGRFVEQYVNSVIPRALMFPYNVNTVVTVK
jgi:polysaccharide export outer membrane protein